MSTWVKHKQRLGLVIAHKPDAGTGTLLRVVFDDGRWDDVAAASLLFVPPHGIPPGSIQAVQHVLDDGPRCDKDLQLLIPDMAVFNTQHRPGARLRPAPVHAQSVNGLISFFHAAKRSKVAGSDYGDGDMSEGAAERYDTLEQIRTYESCAGPSNRTRQGTSSARPHKRSSTASPHKPSRRRAPRAGSN